MRDYIRYLVCLLAFVFIVAPAFSQSQDVQTMDISTYSSSGGPSYTDITAAQSDTGAMESFQGMAIEATTFAQKNSGVEIDAGQKTNKVLFPNQNMYIGVGNWADQNAITLVHVGQSENHALIGGQGMGADILTSGETAITGLDMSQWFKGVESEQGQGSYTDTRGIKSADAFISHEQTSVNFFGADQGVYANDYAAAKGPVSLDITTGQLIKTGPYSINSQDLQQEIDAESTHSSTEVENNNNQHIIYR